MSPEPELMDHLRDAALKRDGDRSRRRHTVSDLLRLSSGQFLRRLIEIEVDEETNAPVRFVAEINELPPGPLRKAGAVETSVWAVGVHGQAVSRRFYHLDEALLAAVEYQHNGGNVNGRGWEFAARALRVPTEEER